ncbi:hypothetical protein DMA11_01880 [Marinilabiliaceae bacterium JC017]|nr:hypothetical protein DMA11_01880 [Marinilabiliaceae bacterium JC017]
MRIPGTLILLCLLMGCHNITNHNTSIEERNRPQRKETTALRDSIKLDEITQLTLDAAIDKYGTPKKEDLFIFGEDNTDYRVGLMNKFSIEEYFSASIIIKELTWQKDKNYNITVWYREKNDKWVNIDIMVWDKGKKL